MEKSLSRKLVLAALASMTLLAGSTAFAQAGKATESGDAIFRAKCAGCHGPDGAGATAMGKMFKLRDLRSADVQKMTDAQLSEVVAKGKGKMPAYENSLGNDRVHAVVAYLRDLAKAKH
jgi:mono/diheme cytochrome c family protein